MMVIFTTNVVPFEWQIPGYQWALIIPLSLVVGCHILLPVRLCVFVFNCVFFSTAIGSVGFADCFVFHCRLCLILGWWFSPSEETVDSVVLYRIWSIQHLDTIQVGVEYQTQIYLVRMWRLNLGNGLRFGLEAGSCSFKFIYIWTLLGYIRAFWSFGSCEDKTRSWFLWFLFWLTTPFFLSCTKCCSSTYVVVSTSN